MSYGFSYNKYQPDNLPEIESPIEKYMPKVENNIKTASDFVKEHQANNNSNNVKAGILKASAESLTAGTTSYIKTEGKTSSEKTALSFDYNKFERNQYLIQFFAVFSDDTKAQKDLSAYITEFKIFNVFTDFVFPVLKIKLMLNYSTLKEITGDFSKIKFRLRIDKLKALTEPSDFVEFQKTNITEPYINDVILVPNDLSRAAFTDSRYAQDNNDNIDAKYDYPLDLELFKKEHLDINKRTFNDSYSIPNGKITVKDVVSIIGENLGQEIVFIEPDNTKEYDEIILIGSNFTQSIYYLQNVYGLYVTGVKVFFDFEKGYIIPRSLIDVPSDDGIKDNIIYVGETSTENVYFSGTYKDNNNSCYHILSPFANNFQYKDVSTKELYGENIKIRSNSLEREITTVDQINLSYSENTKEDEVNSIEGIMKEKMYYNKYDNIFLTTEILYNNCAHLRFLVHLYNPDLSILTLDHKYFVTFVDEDFKLNFEGHYLVETMIIDFTRFSQNFFDSYVTFEMFQASINEEDLKYTIQNSIEDYMYDNVYFYYEVVKGDCLWKLAERFYGDPYLCSKIYEDNKDVIGDSINNYIYPGMRFKIYGISNDENTVYYSGNDTVSSEYAMALGQFYSLDETNIGPVNCQLSNTGDFSSQIEIMKNNADSENWKAHCTSYMESKTIAGINFFREKQSKNDPFYGISAIPKTSYDNTIGRLGCFLYAVGAMLSYQLGRIYTVREMEESIGNSFNANGTFNIDSNMGKVGGDTKWLSEFVARAGFYNFSVKNCGARAHLDYNLLSQGRIAYIIYHKSDEGGYYQLYGSRAHWTCVIGACTVDDQTKAIVLCGKEDLVSPENVEKTSLCYAVYFNN